MKFSFIFTYINYMFIILQIRFFLFICNILCIFVIARDISIITIFVFLGHDRDAERELNHNLRDFLDSIRVSSFSLIQQAFVTLIYYCARQSLTNKDKLIKLHFISQYVWPLSIATS